MEAKLDIAICLGSACFARGNNGTRKVIEEYIRDNGLWDKVNFHGGRCFDHCQMGPVMKIDDTVYEQISEANVIDILNKVFGFQDL